MADVSARSLLPRLLPVAAAFLALTLAACQEASGPLFAKGGGFIFNYRVAEAFAGIVVGAAPGRTLPAGSSIEVTFENPAGGDPIVLTQAVATPPQVSYSFHTPPLTGIRADRDYAVTVRLIAADGSEIEKIEKAFRSEIDQTVLPDAPLTVGPGYTPNPAAQTQ